MLAFAAAVALEHGQTIRAGDLVITGTCTGVIDGVAGTEVIGRHGSSSIGFSLR